MTMLLENRTISMILTVPNVKELSHSVENLDSFSKTTKPPSIPIYHGSIIHIEQHRDNENTSDLIVRVPNFHHLSLPSVTISINDNQLNETESQRDARIKRRAPICPIVNGSQNENKTGLTNTKRFAIGLRKIITNFKLKRSTNINEITIIPVLPDVEIITEEFQVPKKMNKNQTSTSKFLTPKVLFIKRKCFKIKKKRVSPNSINSQTDTEDNVTNENSRTNLSIKDDESIKIPHEDKTINSSVEQQSTTIAQLIPNIPIFVTSPESTSTHPYSEFSSSIETPTNILQPDIFKTNPKLDLTTDIQSFEHIDEDNLDERVYVVHPNGDTYSECYEVTYEFDPEFRRFIDNQKQQIYLSEIQNQPSIKLNIDPFEYQDITSSSLIPWLSILPPNNYEQIEEPQRDPGQEPTIPRVTFQSFEDLSQTSHDQTSTYQPESISGFSSSQETNQIICDDHSPIINEDYTVILQFLRHALKIESTPDEDYNEFNKQIQQIFQTDKINELE